MAFQKQLKWMYNSDEYIWGFINCLVAKDEGIGTDEQLEYINMKTQTKKRCAVNSLISPATMAKDKCVRFPSDSR